MVGSEYLWNLCHWLNVRARAYPREAEAMWQRICRRMVKLLPSNNMERLSPDMFGWHCHVESLLETTPLVMESRLHSVTLIAASEIAVLRPHAPLRSITAAETGSKCIIRLKPEAPIRALPLRYHLDVMLGAWPDNCARMGWCRETIWRAPEQTIAR